VGAAEWERARAAGSYRGDTLDSEGYIHCSTAEQWPRVLAALYSGRRDLVLLEIDQARLECELRWEDLQGSGELFPHIYGPLPAAAVISAQILSS
jgi:uncharacterized protein (DUF952 family)